MREIWGANGASHPAKQKPNQRKFRSGLVHQLHGVTLIHRNPSSGLRFQRGQLPSEFASRRIDLLYLGGQRFGPVGSQQHEADGRCSRSGLVATRM